MKVVYKLKQHYSTLHKMLNEEGLGVQDISDIIGQTEQTTRKYLKDPTMLRVKHIRHLSNELELDANFLLDIIYG